MARRIFAFDDPDRFVTGALGEPGDRTFYLQARQGGAVVSVVLEKAQVAALAGRLSDLLDAVTAGAALEPGHRDDGPLEEPLDELFRVGVLALAWDPSRERVTVEAQPPTEAGEFVDVADTAPDGPDVVRVQIAPGPAREFVRRAASLVAAGRPLCPFCGEPLEATGHFCTRPTDRLN